MPIFLSILLLFASAGALASFKDRNSDAITVYTAVPTEVLNGNGGIRLDHRLCQRLNGGPMEGRFDCRELVETWFDAPAIHPFDMFVQDGRSQYKCQLLEITTLTYSSAFQAVQGIGFYSNQGKGRFIPKDRLRPVGEVYLANGEVGLLHRFLAHTNCWSGSATSSRRRVYSFKPYLQYQGDDGHIYRVWDQLEGNYEIDFQQPRIDNSDSN